MQVRIYQPAKTAMQSGLAKTKQWLLETVPAVRQEPDPLMGWNGGTPTTMQVRLSFPSQEEAIAYATKHGLDYTVQTPHAKALKPKSYADNFAFKANL